MTEAEERRMYLEDERMAPCMAVLADFMGEPDWTKVAQKLIDMGKALGLHSETKGE